ncbi:transport permease protein [Cellulomonas chitinilytica]|uniref:Transport permease protein n=1 Tax=Cellulomonas chitinilytica TaxID=398759 RepID=A0A919P3W1_9CELL|nr:ABC transporter permease [Cellulomonas chitinilytica]GIG20929.1 transport permease protein [Cellulomonas chitinilytica]
MTATTTHPGAAPTWRRVLAQTSFETRAILRNGEQLLVTIIVPVLVLVGLTRGTFVDLDTAGESRIDFLTPGILALAVMTSSFTSQAIASSFDRRNGVLRLLSTTPLGRGGLLAGKVLGVLGVEVVQIVVIGLTAVLLGWRPDPAGLGLALVAVVLGTGAFTSLALLVAGTLRAEAVLAVANLALIVLAVAGGVIIPASRLPGPLEHVALLLPSGALGEAMRETLLHGVLPPWSVVVLVAWTAALGWGAGRLFRWH